MACSDAAGFAVRRLNRLRVRLYARSLGRNAKSDRFDARVIARYIAAAETVPEILDPGRGQGACSCCGRAWIAASIIAAPRVWSSSAAITWRAAEIATSTATARISATALACS